MTSINRFNWGRTIVLGLASLCSSMTVLEACTGMQIKAKDNSILNGRTVEFGMEIDFSLVVVPRGYQFTSAAPNGPGLTYQAKYAAVGGAAFNSEAIMDGINEKGLASGVFYFPGYAKYAKITAENQSKALSPGDFTNWVLTQFATVDEVKKALANVVIAPTVVKEWGNTPPPFHYIVYDKLGNSIVIEPINGMLIAYENKLGVFTNSPTFDWHMTNLRNFINLTPFNANPLKVEGITFSPFGQGSGMVGLPGDFTPPSRFVRASIYTITATPSADAKSATSQLFHLLNQFDIPVGAARQEENGKISTDYTQLTCVRDPQALKFYYRTYEDQTIRMVDLNKFDLNAKKVVKMPTKEKDWQWVNVSSQLK